MAAARILVLRGGAIGDGVVTLPVLSALRERWPEGHLALAGYPRLTALARTAGLVDAVRSLEEPDFARLFSHRPSFSPAFVEWVRGFDLVFSFLYDPDGLVPRNLETVGVRQVLSLDPRPVAAHAADHLATILHPLALYPDPVVPYLPWPIRPLSPGIPASALAIHPGSGSPGKNWPWSCFLEIAHAWTAAGQSCFFIAGEVELEQLPELDSCPFPVLRGATLEGLCDALAGTRAFLGNDSGPAHLAAALGRPVVALFGPSDPQRWAPRGRGGVTVLKTGETTAAIPVPLVLETLRRVVA
jgi:heptosyltransferase III